MIYTLICLFAVALSVVMFILSNPILRPYIVVRNEILQLTPIGMDIVDVLAIINEKAETDDWSTRGGGIEGGEGRFRGQDFGFPELKEERGIVVSTERHWDSRIALNVAWGFNGEGKLIKIYVKRMYYFLS